jgi:hypothetical protein
MTDTLTMRLSIGNTPATVCTIFSARRRKLPLQLTAPSVTFPSATDTETPSGAIERFGHVLRIVAHP